MTSRTLHPALDVLDMIDLLRAGVREVTGITSLDDLCLIQACAEAVGLEVWWCLARNAKTAELVEVMS